MLRILAQETRVRIWKNENAMVAINRSEFSACISRQTRMAHRINVAGANSLAHLEAWGHIYVAVGMNASEDRSWDLLWGQWRGRFGGTRRGRAALNLRSGNQAPSVFPAVDVLRRSRTTALGDRYLQRRPSQNDFSCR